MKTELIFLILFTVMIAIGYIMPIFKIRESKTEKILGKSADEIDARIKQLKSITKLYYIVIPIIGFVAWESYLNEHTTYMFITFVIVGLAMNYPYREIELLKTILALKTQDFPTSSGRE